MSEGELRDTPYGLEPATEGWYVLNLAEALAVRNAEKGGAHFRLEGREARFRDVAVNVTVLWPGDPNGYYHSEAGQEGFLVLAGECLLVVLRHPHGRDPPRGGPFLSRQRGCGEVRRFGCEGHARPRRGVRGLAG